MHALGGGPCSHIHWLAVGFTHGLLRTMKEVKKYFMNDGSFDENRVTVYGAAREVVGSL